MTGREVEMTGGVVEMTGREVEMTGREDRGEMKRIEMTWRGWGDMEGFGRHEEERDAIRSARITKDFSKSDIYHRR
jgi:hypothetical protein